MEFYETCKTYIRLHFLREHENFGYERWYHCMFGCHAVTLYALFMLFQVISNCTIFKHTLELTSHNNNVNLKLMCNAAYSSEICQNFAILFADSINTNFLYLFQLPKQRTDYWVPIFHRCGSISWVEQILPQLSRSSKFQVNQN